MPSEAGAKYLRCRTNSVEEEEEEEGERTAVPGKESVTDSESQWPINCRLYPEPPRATSATN